MLYVDLPTLPEFRALHAYRDDACVSIYLETSPLSQQCEASRIELGNLMRKAAGQLEEKGVDRHRIAAMQQLTAALADDYDFWQLQAHSLAVFVTPEAIRSFRLPNRLAPTVQVSDRFHLKPLLRSITFRNAAYVLALSENSVRLIEVFPDLPAAVVEVPGMPEGAAEFTERDATGEMLQNPRVQASEGQKLRLAQYARAVDRALRPVLAGRDMPMILAATQPLASLFRGVCTYPGLVEQSIAKNADRLSEDELSTAARPIMDSLHAEEVAQLTQRYQDRVGSERATTDIAHAARAATFGAIDALLVDIDEVVGGTIDEETGVIQYAGRESAEHYDVIDEVVARALGSGARVLGVRRDDIPGGAALAAILRYPMSFG
ncbi:MAG: hypothetical protein WCY98_06990 [Castellaniella sp.]